MLRKYNFTFLLGLFFVSVSSQSTKPFFIPDSLKNYSFEELYDKQFIFQDSPKEKIYVEAYLHKAKNENDTIRIAHGYSQKIVINSSNNFSLKYCDSLIKMTKSWNHKLYPGHGYMVKGLIYNNSDKEKLAVENLILAKFFALKNNNIEQLYYVNSGIAEIKNMWGDYKSAKAIFLSQLDLLIKNKKEFTTNKGNLYTHEYISTLGLLADSYLLNKQFDSAYSYNRLGIRESLALNDTLYYADFLFSSGEIAYYNNEYDKALDSLNKSVNIGRLGVSPERNVFFHYYAGNIFLSKNRDTLAHEHFIKADSLFDLTNRFLPEIKDIQHYFVKYYKEKGDSKNQLKYINRLIHVDSIIDDKRNYLNEIIKNEYDIPKLLAEKEEILQTLNKEKTQLNFINTGLVGVVLLILSYAVYNYRKNRMYKLKLKQFLQNREQELKAAAKKKKTSLKNTSTISDEIVKDVLKKLDRFEKMNYYLNNKITLASLAKRWKTNSSYLSKIINEHKQKSFTNYLSDLRIDYSIEKIITDKEFRKFKIEAIGLEVGFNNGQSFAKQFHLKTGVYPSFFIKEIENLNQTG